MKIKNMVNQGLRMADLLQCAAASGVRDEGRPLAISLQERVANHRMRRGSKVRVVSDTEKASQGVRYGTGRRTHVNCRPSVESCQMAPKPESEVAPRSIWTRPAYGPDGVRHRGSASLLLALMLNCGNLRRRCEAKGTSPKGEADSSNAPSRDGAARSSVEAAVMAAEQRGGVILGDGNANRVSGRSLA
jgi:hypothetical protein